MIQAKINDFRKYLVHFCVLMFLQILVLNRVPLLFDGAFDLPKIHIYILFIIILPLKYNKILLLFTAFATGLLLDNFENSIGVHAAAATFIAFIKPYIANIYTQRYSTESQSLINPTISDFGFRKLFGFTFLLILLYSLFYYFFESFSFGNTGYLLGKAMYSCIITFVFASIYNILFNNK